jgi:hypothetical protein
VQNPEVAKKIKGKILTNNTIDAALNELSLVKDFSRDENKIDFIHRTVDGIDMYFVSNKTNEAISETVEFRTTNEQVEYWDPVSAKQYKVVNAQSKNGTTKLNLNLSALESAFIVFTDVDRDLPIYKESPNSQTTEISGPWEVSFPENWGAPTSVKLNELISWTDHEEKGINYFSGTASYENSFTVSKEAINNKKPITIDLGEVYDVAEIFVNGNSAGVLWTYPYQLNIENFVTEGYNKLEVKITNLWINRLTGDLTLPEEKRFCKTNVPAVTEEDTGYGDLTWRIQTSGLLGPVMLKTIN